MVLDLKSELPQNAGFLFITFYGGGYSKNVWHMDIHVVGIILYIGLISLPMSSNVSTMLYIGIQSMSYSPGALSTILEFTPFITDSLSHHPV